MIPLLNFRMADVATNGQQEEDVSYSFDRAEFSKSINKDCSVNTDGLSLSCTYAKANVENVNIFGIR